MGTNWWISFVRTLVAPLLVGLVTANLALLAFHDIGFLLHSTIVAIAACLYYYVARLLQIRWPLSGFLLVIAAEPYYLRDEEVDETDRLLISVQRTAVPLAVGWAVAQLAHWVVRIAQPVGLAVQLGVTALFYGVLRYVEERSVAGTRKREVAGILLGVPAIPHY